MDQRAINSLVGLRTAIGVGAWAAPRITGRLFGLDPVGNPQLPYMARLFGVRDIALAVGTYTTDGGQRTQWLQLGVACDLADAAAGARAGRGGELPGFASALVTGTALAAAGLGLAALQSGD